MRYRASHTVTPDVIARALSDARPIPYWLDRPERPAPSASLSHSEETDLAIVGGGFTGLWGAVLAKEADPARDVVLIEADAVAEGASGRNGGMMDASLTHGVGNGYQHFPDQMGLLDKLGRENYEALLATLARYDIDARYESTGVLAVGTAPHEVEELRGQLEQLHALGHDAEWLERDALRAEVDSPTYLAGLWRRSGRGVIDPGRLAWGLRKTALALGVRIYEGTPLRELRGDRGELQIRCPGGTLRTRQVLLATNAFRGPVRRMRSSVIPIWDYVLVTEPLSAAQRAAIGWQRRQGVRGAGNRFHYYRLTPDDGILWGGYDAIYHYGSRLRKRDQQRPASHTMLARQFLETFPQLEGIRFSHRWGGPIASTTRFTLSVGSSHRGRVAWAIGYTGLGVVASRFGARAALERLAGEGETLSLDLVRRRPVPWPPEPLRWLGVRLTQRALAKADRNRGRRCPWLRLLDRLGLGFDS
jgi:glycine/D-amino acid oxidase-like deaminating enzyme